MSNSPIVQLRDGLIKVAVWENTSENKVFYTTTLVKSYKDGDNDQYWKETSNLNTDDLLRASRLLQRAYDAILELRQAP